MEQIIKRLKSFVWRAGATVAVAVFAYITNVGDIFSLDWKMLANIAVLAFVALALGELTKYLNN